MATEFGLLSADYADDPDTPGVYDPGGVIEVHIGPRGTGAKRTDITGLIGCTVNVDDNLVANTVGRLGFSVPENDAVEHWGCPDGESADGTKWFLFHPANLGTRLKAVEDTYVAQSEGGAPGGFVQIDPGTGVAYPAQLPAPSTSSGVDAITLNGGSPLTGTVNLTPALLNAPTNTEMATADNLRITKALISGTANTLIRGTGSDVAAVTPPSTTGTYALAVVDGVMQWVTLAAVAQTGLIQDLDNVDFTGADAGDVLSLSSASATTITLGAADPFAGTNFAASDHTHPAQLAILHVSDPVPTSGLTTPALIVDYVPADPDLGAYLGASSALNVATRSITLADAVLVGQTIVAANAVSGDGSSNTLVPHTFSDSKGNVWTMQVDQEQGTSVHTSLWRCYVTVPLVAGDTITCTHTGALATRAHMTICAASFDGVADANKAASAVGGAGNSTVATATTASVTAPPKNLGVSVVEVFKTGIADRTLGTLNGQTLLATVDTTGGSARRTFFLWKQMATTGTFIGGGTLSETGALSVCAAVFAGQD